MERAYRTDETAQLFERIRACYLIGARDEVEVEMDPDTAIMDLPAFMLALDNDEELLLEILIYYIDDSSRIVTEIAQAISVGDAGTAQRLAHTLKGSSANVHAYRLRDAAYQLEAAITRNELAGQAQMLENIVQCRNELVVCLRSERPDLFSCEPA